jgi:HEAT repeat protein
MPKRRLILGILGLGILAALIVAFTRPREPYYQGRSLTDWVLVLQSDPPEYTMATNAIRSIGTNAIPFFLEWIHYTPPPPKRQSLAALNRFLQWLQARLGAQGEWELKDRQLVRAAAATFAFAPLGSQARTAVPELVRLLNQPEPGFAADRGARCLASLGELAIPPFMAALTSTNSEVRRRAAYNIGTMGDKARPAVPILIQLLTDKHAAPARAAAHTLSLCEFEPALVVPILTTLLQHPEPNRRSMAAVALGRYGSEARSAVPPLLAMRNDTDANVRWQVEQAIRDIAPETITNAPPR